MLPLGYSTGANAPRPKPRTPFAGRIAIGCFGYVLLTAGWFALAAAFPSRSQYAFDGWVLMTIALLALSLYVRIRYGFSGVGYGILMSLGAFVTIGVLLIVGFILLLIATCGGKNGSSIWGGSGGSGGISTGTAPTTPYTTAPATEPTTEPTTEPAATGPAPAVGPMTPPATVP